MSLAALAASITPSHAASFTAATETELDAAITAAQTSPDAASTITLTDSFAVTGLSTSTTGKNISVVTGTNTLTLATGNTFYIGAGTKLTLTGNVVGTGTQNTDSLVKQGTGDLVINGVTASNLVRIDLEGGTTLVDGGSQVQYGTTTGTPAQLRVGVASNATATLTISGDGTVLQGTGSKSIDLGNASSGAATLNVEDGGELEDSGTGIRLLGQSTINITGENSSLQVGSFAQGPGTIGVVNVTDGGLFDVSGGATFGGAGTTVQGSVDGLVSGPGSKLETTTLYLQAGSLSVLDGGVVDATAAFIANGNRVAVPNFTALVSGTGSELNADTLTVGTTGTGILTIADDGKVAVSDGASALVLGGVNANSNATLNIGGAAGEVATAAGTLDASAITLAAANATINFNHTETGYAFDMPITGAGAINQVAGHTIFTADQLGFTGLTTVEGGVLEVNGVLGGTVNVDGGTLSGIGTVGATSLASGGAISPGGDSIGTLTIDGDYAGSGGLLQIQTVLGGDGSATDKLVVTGNTSGTTNVAVTNMGGLGGVTNTGIKIVDVGGSSAGTFNLIGDVVVNGEQAVVGGAYLYGLHQGTLTVADGDWYLRNVVNPDDSGTPLFQPAAPVIEAYAGVLQNFNKTETLQQRVGNRSWGKSGNGGQEGNGIWGRMEGSTSTIDPTSTTGGSYDENTWRLQAGVDAEIGRFKDGSLVGGVNMESGTLSADVSSPSGAGSISGRAYGLGATLTYYGDQGFYLDAQGKLTWFDSTLSSHAAGNITSGNAGFGSALSLEAGQRLALGANWSVTPQAQLSYSAVSFDDFTDPFGSTVALLDGNNLTGRLGISADYETTWQDRAGGTGRTHLYGITNVSYDFSGGTATSVGSDTLASKTDPLWGGIGAGGSINWAGDRLSLYGEASFNTSLDTPGKSYSLGATAGIRGKF